MLLVHLLTQLLVAGAAFARFSWRPRDRPLYDCTERHLDVPIDADIPVINTAAPASNVEATELLVDFSNITQVVIQGEQRVTTTYRIWTSLCLPNDYEGDGTVELTVHGIGADHTYFEFGGPRSQFLDNNYVSHAASQGRAVLLYDRLGAGKSARPAGIGETQIAINVEIAAYLVNWLRKGVDGATFERVIGHGHSNGSLQLLNVVAKFGNIVDGLILTGFTPYTGKLAATLAAMGFILANQGPSKFRDLPNNYLLNDGIWGFQMVFFSYPGFDESVMRRAYATRGTITVGELLTQYGNVASNYTNPVHIITGACDYIFCSNGCYAPVDGYDNIVESSRSVFPAVTDFTTYIPPNSGHSPHLHINSQETFDEITNWFSGL